LKLFNYFWLKFVKVDIENPIALHFIMQDELFFLKEDREKQDSLAPVMAIIEEETPVAVVTTEPKPDFTYTGKKGGLLILVHYTDQEFIHEIHLSALENILKRKNVAIADVAILNMAKNTGTDFESLVTYFDPSKILLLGKGSLPQGIIKLDINQVKQTGNTNLLYSFSFDEMMDSPDNKRTFWEQMKNF
jgi:hypothetical protein